MISASPSDSNGEILPCYDTTELTVTVTAASEVVVTGLFAAPANAPDGMDAMSLNGWAAELGTPYSLLVATENGMAAIDLTTQQQISGANDLGSEPWTDPPLGVVGLGSNSRSQSMGLLVFGNFGAYLRNWESERHQWFEWALNLEFLAAVLDAVSMADQSDAALYISSSGHLKQVVWNEETQGYAESMRVLLVRLSRNGDQLR